MTPTDLKNAIIGLGEAFVEENNAAFDLWTWLPSYKVTQKHHGDYASEHTPSVEDVLIEAAKFIALNAGHEMHEVERKEWFETCACGDDHTQE